ncbi:phytanoyl-CoA dioxygenase family protein [Cochlodiniinecator piscidefendens]|uniref:hypothetical protein n=1 Tax=Cochlodiniinecator piscidefendens TaxID=2715756 RepID=UPI0014089A19|nr:hypothetical protein [Cochlodiniinecator piscidefendens]
MYHDKGWQHFSYDAKIAEWVTAAKPAALESRHKPEVIQEWLDCEGTWFIGVDALDNDPVGAIDGSDPLCGGVMDFLQSEIGDIPRLHKAQVSIIYPGYPRPRSVENEVGFRYRLNRDAAHVDGILPVGEKRQRMIKEPHAFVLGLPLNDCNEHASPMVVWEGSHHIMQRAFVTALAPHAPETWDNVDLTETYQAARREVFETCPRVVVTAKPGEAYVMHRHTLHGVAPWGAGAIAPEEGRMIAYFRPEFDEGVARWIRD